jgi:tetratricopeptide (TPR) repeat protein/predicted Ser/Thr protein kinase
MEDADGSGDDETLDGARALPSRPRDLRRGSLIGRYVVLAPVGAGGMGLVFAAHDPELDRKVALKVLRDDTGRPDGTEGRRKLLREAQALARLAHPNVVAIHDTGVDQGRSFIAMEFIVGQTLRQWLDRAPRSPDEVIAVFLAAGRGLAAAHAGGIVHGDFKPSNVLIADDGRVVVTDFGLARPLDELPRASALEDTAARVSTDALTPTSLDLAETAGTPAYMAPEQFIGGGASSRSDLFAFAVALWEGLAGRRPFTGASMPALMSAIAQGRIDEASQAKIPRWLRAPLRRALAGKPDDRFAGLEPMLAVLASDPRRAMRRGASFAAIAIAGVGILGGRWWMDRAARRECDDDAASISLLVDPATLAAIRRSFVDTGSQVAKEAADHADRTLAEYAATWTNQRRDNCVARVEGTRSDLDAARTASCLDDAKVALVELIGAMRRVTDRSAVMGVAPALVRLPMLAQCSDDRRLARRIALPEESARRDRVLELRRRLAKLEIDWRFTQKQAVLPEAAVLVDEAIATGWPPVVAEALLLQGRMHEGARELAEAHRAYKRAFNAALAAESDEVAAEAAISLASIVGLGMQRLSDGDDWLDIAETLYDRVGEQGFARSELLRTRGRIAEGHADFPKALAFAERGLAMRTAALGEDSPLLEPLLGDLGHLYAERDEYERALEYLRRQLELLERAMGGPHSDIPTVLSDIAGVYAGQGKLEEAERMYVQALGMNDRLQGSDHVTRANLLNNLANLYDDFGRYDEALGYYEQTRASFEEAYGREHPLVAVVLANSSVTLLAMGRAEEALANAEQSLRIREASLGKQHSEVAGSLNALSDAQRALGRLEDARASAARSVAIREAALEPDDQSLVASRSTLGDALLELGAFDEAALQLGLAVESSQRRLGDHYQTGLLLRQLAIAELGRGRVAAARRVLARAIEIAKADPEGAADHARSEHALAKLEWDANNRELARQLGEHARQIMRDAGMADTPTAAQIDATLAAWAATRSETP